MIIYQKGIESVKTRLLGKDDAADYQRLRLRSLEEHPEAFGASLAEEANTETEQIIHELTSGLPDNGVIGIFMKDELVGITSINRHPRPKTNHRAYLGAMYVLPEYRGQGLARFLLRDALDYLKTRPGVEDVVLAVTAGNSAARKIYVDVGFKTWGIDPRYLKIGDMYYDIEWMILSSCEG
jgi:RimJ/RimL family protein N-acetyltransferase